MNRIGFMVSDQEEGEQQDLGYVESQPGQVEEHWTDDLGDFFFRNLMGFCMVYGFFAAVRDMIKSLF